MVAPGISFCNEQRAGRVGLLSWKGRPFMIHTVHITYIYIYPDVIAYYIPQSIQKATSDLLDLRPDDNVVPFFTVK